MLSDDDRAFYAANGYLMVENAVTPDQLARLQALAHGFIEASRSVSESNEVYDLDAGHSAAQPRLTRVKVPHRRDPFFWEVLRHSRMTEVLNDLLGPDTTLLGSGSYFHALGQRRFWDDLQQRTITGTPCLTPRLEALPVRMPLPPAPDSSSIFRTQRSAGAKSAFGGPGTQPG